MDPKAVFEILMRENGQMLLAFLRAAVRDPDAVDDLFQETMLTAWRKLDEFDRDKPFGPWLRGIAGNLTLAYYRNHARQAATLDASSLEWLENRFARIQNLRGDTLAEKLAALRDCVQALPEHYRQPVHLRYAESRSLAEIGSMLQLALDTLKKRLTRAKGQLAECLERKLQTAESVR